MTIWTGNPLQYTILYWAGNPLQCDHLGRQPIKIYQHKKKKQKQKQKKKINKKKGEGFSQLFFFTKLTIPSQKKINFLMHLHRKHCKEGATVVTQFWIHQVFLKCYFISKNPKK